MNSLPPKPTRKERRQQPGADPDRGQGGARRLGQRVAQRDRQEGRGRHRDPVPPLPHPGIAHRELYRHDIEQLIDLAPALLESRPPLAALRRWFDEVARYGQLKFGAAEVIHAATNGGLDDEYYEPFVRAIAVLLEAGAADGSLKPGLDPEDVLLQLSVLWRIDPARNGEARAARILDLIVDGLRA